MVPLALLPGVVGLIEPSPAPPEPGSFAVLVNVAVSVTGFPKSTGPAPAAVEMCGWRGVTVKHSVLEWSDESGTPLTTSPEKSARQQYRPTFVIVAVSDAYVP